MPLPAQPTASWTRSYSFDGPDLGPTFEWNHNPDIDSFDVDNGLTLRTASVTDDIYAARNTLTHRIHGEFPIGTVEIDFTEMADGDRCGLAAFRDQSAFIGVHRDGDQYSITTTFNATIDEWDGSTVGPGEVQASTPVPEGVTKVWFKLEMDARPNGSRDANFFYSLDGSDFVGLGGTYELYTGWAFFLGYRFGIYNYATKALGGSVKVVSFTSA
jgi:hypothetical protein